MEKEEITIEKTIRTSGYSINPVVHSRLYSKEHSRGVSFICSKEPLAVIVSDKSSKGTLHMISQDVSRQSLFETMPDLRDLVSDTAT